MKSYETNNFHRNFDFSFLFCGFAQSETSPPPIDDPDVFFKMSWNDEKTKLGNFADEIIKRKDSVGVVTLKVDKTTSYNQLKNRLKRIIKYLIETRKIERTRVRLVLQEFPEEQTMYFILPKFEVPQCENCLIVSTDDRFKELSAFFNQKIK